MSLPDERFDRWLANANAAGISLSREEAERIASSGLADRLTTLDELFERLDAWNRVPDYLADTADGEIHDELQ